MSKFVLIVIVAGVVLVGHTIATEQCGSVANLVNGECVSPE